jgi:hypothetical protein
MEKIGQKVDAGGLVTREYVTHEGDLIVDYKQDVEPVFDAVKSVRNDSDNWQRQMKKDMVHAFHIPNVVVTELAAYGCDVYTAPLKDIKKALRAIGKYELCDMTGKNV